MHTSSHRRACQRGQGTTPIFVFLGIVVLSLVFFFALTLPRQLERKKRVAAQQAAAAATPAKKPAAPKAAAPAPVKPREQPPLPDHFASPRGFVQAVAGRLSDGDVDAAFRLLGDEALSADQAAFFQMVFAEAKLKPAAGSPLREIGDVGDLYRWAIRLSDTPEPTATPTDPLAHQTAAAGKLEIEIDVGRDPAKGWKATAVHFPEPLRGHIAARLGAARVPAAVAAAADEQNDPLKITAQFLQAVLEQDYSLARRVTDTEKVTREKVAGLCILFEEGGYHLADQRPLSATATGGESAWVIVKVASAQAAPESDFGIELQKDSAGAWRVAGVNFSKMLAGYMQAAGATEGVAYAPIVKNPSGGESLVVYFDFNEAGLVPRAQRQLEIVANLLRDDTKRKLRLSGFADAIGSDDYNRRLSAARAYAAKNALIALGVSPEQIITEGLGKLQPLDANTKPDGSDNPEGRSRNRRTEIFLDF